MGVKTRKLGNINSQIIQWQAVHVSDGSTALTTVAGRGYFINTTSGTQTVNLPASPKLGDKVSMKDFARTWGTNKITMGSAKFDGVASQTPEFNTTGQTISLVYMGDSQGWSLINEDTSTGLGATFTSATGGTVTTSGNDKIHTFTGDGNFVVASIGNAAGSGDKVSYLVVAGGGSGGADVGGGGGAGGFREAIDAPKSTYTVSPIKAPAGLTITAATFPITVGGGGAAPGPPQPMGNVGSNSIFSTITSAGGGLGGGGPAPGTNKDGGNGGSGGGGGGWSNPTRSPCIGNKGSGNTPPVSPAQGFDGGEVNPGGPNWTGAGGGGATAVGVDGSSQPTITSGTKAGGAGATTHITASPVTYAGGGTGGHDQTPVPSTTVAGANTGTGGGGAGNHPSPNRGNAGGKGIVVIRYKYQI